MNDTIHYNGYTFPAQSHVEVKTDLVYDEAERTVVYHKYTLSVEALIAPENGEDIARYHHYQLQQRLTKAGQYLRIHHDGFGPPLEVNAQSVAGGYRDVSFGPKPRVLSWDPVGHTGAVEVAWQCEFCVPVCDGTSGVRTSGIAALNYSISHTINDRGYTTRTISGYLEIAMTRVGRNIPDTADSYREKINPRKLVNFHRTYDWNVSPDKKRADFSIVDREIESPNAFPTGVTNITANHRMRFSKRTSSAKLFGSITASIELAVGWPRQHAWQIFRSIVDQRLKRAGSKHTAFLEDFEVNESLYANQVEFSINYTLLAELADIFNVTGLFESTPDNWRDWDRSISHVQTHRGLAQMRHLPADDQIVDLCTNDFIRSPSPRDNRRTPPSSRPKRLCNPKPTPDKSWLRFEGTLATEEQHDTVLQIAIGEDDLKRKDFNPSDPNPTNAETDKSKEVQRFIEEAPAGLEFLWVGYAERAGYTIPRPGKLKVGGVDLVPIGRQEFRQKRLGKLFCQPVYAAGWRLRYVVNKRPVEVSADEGDPVNV